MNRLLILDGEAPTYEAELRKKYLQDLKIVSAQNLAAAEPLPDDSPLWAMENIVVTPHNSAYSFPEQVAEIFAANDARYLAGSPLDYLVDFARGY
jgi:phosphoglycerate dehydrogenase-like enzyme